MKKLIKKLFISKRVFHGYFCGSECLRNTGGVCGADCVNG